MTGVLASLQSAFPDLYGPPDETAQNDGVETTGSAPAAVEPAALPADVYSKKIEDITGRFAKTRVSADELEQYLQTAQQEAKESEARALTQADEEFTPAWRTVGLPMKPSHLRLDDTKMSTGRLVNPKAIMAQYQSVKSKEVLNPPRTYEYNDTSIQPNYLNNTSNMAQHTRMIPLDKLERVRSTYLKERTWPHLSSDEVSQRIAESEERRRVQDLRMPAAQYDLEKKIIQSMHHKLSFLRNPRYPLPPAVKMLQSQFVPGPQWGVPDKPRPAPPIKANLTSDPDKVFVVEPAEVVFTSYEVGETYMQLVRIRNVTNVARGLRLFPPASQYFHASLPRFPTENACIAPGMAAEVTVRFTPDSLADYDDEMAVDTATSRFSVPIKARRPPPELTLPQELHVGEVLTGNRKVAQFTFRNAGGAGRFRVIPESYWPGEWAEAPQDMAGVGPFEVWPLFFDLSPGDEAVLNVSFEPNTMGVHDERLVMVCDNCQVKDFHIRGLASDVGIKLTAVDGASPDDDASLAQPLWFGEVVPGATFAKRLTVTNTTTLPFPFQWCMSARPQTRAVKPVNVPLGLTSAAALQGGTSFAAEDATQQQPGLFEGGSQRQGERGDDALSLAGTVGGLVPAQRKGRVDLVALGMDPHPGVFRVTPGSGVLHPGEAMEFAINFAPAAVERFERWAQLKVDKTTPGQIPQGCNVDVLEVGLEGVGTWLELEVSPKRLVLPGMLMPGASVTRSLTLRNPTRAPANFSFEGLMRGVLSVEPQSGTVPPLSSLEAAVTFTAGEAPGAQQHRLTCTVAHGPAVPVDVVASIGTPRVEVVTTRLDFGLVRLKGRATRTLRLRNTSNTCSTPWEVSELPRAKAGPQQQQAVASRAASAAATPRTAAAAAASTEPADGSASAADADATVVEAGAAADAAAVDAVDELVAEDLVDGPAPEVEPEPEKTHLQFFPSSGVLGPGEEIEVDVTLLALSDGQHHSTVKVVSPGGHLSCLEAFAAVVTPRVVVSRPRVDLGVTFTGVTTTFTTTLKNLALLPVDFSFTVEGEPAEVQQQGQQGEGEPQQQQQGRGQWGAQAQEGSGNGYYGFELPAEVKIRPDYGTLDPGEEMEVTVRFTPRVAGPATLFGVCSVEGAPLPTGFVVNTTVRGLDVGYELLTPEQFEEYKAALSKPRARKRRDDVSNFVGMTNLSPEVLARIASNRTASTTAPFAPAPPRHHVANFGSDVPLGKTRHMYLVVTNRTAIPTSLSTHLDTFGVDDVSKLTDKARLSPAPRLGSIGRQGSGGSLSSGGLQRLRVSKYAPIKLSGDAEHTAPYRSPQGNDMVATRRLQEESERVLGDKGLAISVNPPQATLAPWSRLVLQLSAFNDMCGDYFDTLHVSVGDLQPVDIPIRVGVAGTPLVVQKERVLVKGLRERQWRTGLDFGQAPRGVDMQRTFYVFNTGSLDMHLSWVFYRFQDMDDASNPVSRLVEVEFETVAVSGTDTGGSSGAEAGAGSADDAAGTSSKAPSMSGVPEPAPPPPAAPAAAAGKGSAPAKGQPAAPGRGPAAQPAASAAQPSPAAAAAAPSRGALSDSGSGSEAADGARSGLEHAPSASGADALSPPAVEEVRLKVLPHAAPDVQPFVVEPAEQVIKGGESARFTVSFTSQRDAPHKGYLLGVQKVFSPEVPISLKIWPTADKGGGVGAMLSGTFHPHAGSPPAPLQPLRVDLTASTSTSRLEPDGASEMVFVCHSTQPKSHPAYKHTITLTNLQACPLLFSLSSRGPFDLVSAVPSAPQDAALYAGTTGTLPRLAPGCMYLPPRESVDASLRFTPPQVDHRDDYALDGSLVVSYTNGNVQELPLQAHVMHPALELRLPQGQQPQQQQAQQPQGEGEEAGEQVEVPPMLEFGRVHVQAPKTCEVVLSNPTLVDALWAVTQPGGKPIYPRQEDVSAGPPSAAAAAAAGAAAGTALTEARFGPFIVRPASGLLPGRGLKLPKTQKVSITFAPTDNKEYRELLVFGVSKGRPCSLTLHGVGSYEETEEHQARLFTI